MYKCPENCNRVNEIKSKFKELSTNDHRKVLRSRSSGDPTPPESPSRVPKRNVKRTPAFRLEKSNAFDRSRIQSRSLTKEPPTSQHVARICSKFESQIDITPSLPDPVDNKSDKHLTLEEALQRPLPVGPAPKKPPRTFEHAPLKEMPSDASNSSDCEGVKCKVKHKHSPRYMLSKLETVLRNKIKHKGSCFDIKVKSDCESDDSGTEIDNLVDNEIVKQPEPVYAVPCHSKKTSRRNEMENLKNLEKNVSSLHYMSTPIVFEDQNLCHNTTKIEKMSNITPPKTLNNNTVDSPSLKIKNLIDVFEKKQSPNHINTEKPSNNIAKSTSSLPRKLDMKDILNDTKESSDEFQPIGKTSSVEEIIKKFHTYVRTMPKYKKCKINSNARLFTCCLIVVWDKQPKIVFSYPSKVQLPERIENLCYPEATNSTPDISLDAQSYSLVITNDKGERTFGYCRRVIPEGSTKCIPLAYCILSKHRAPRFYKKILAEMESRHGIPDKLRDELIHKFYYNKFPEPGESIRIVLPNVFLDYSQNVKNNDLTFKTKINNSSGYSCVQKQEKNVEVTLTLHHDFRYEEADLKMLHKLPGNILVKIFGSLLLERKVILISCVISKLSSCVDALQSILYPFTWPHTFIPILPQCLWDVVESPTPVICGVLSVSVVNNHKIEDGIVVDLDAGTILREEGDEEKILSGTMKKTLNQALFQANSMPSDDYVHSVLLSDAYMRVFIQLLKNYKNYILNNTFDKENFIKNAKTKGMRRFLKWFTETAMFIGFIETAMQNPQVFNFFDNKAEMYGSEESNVILSKLRDWKRL